MSTNRTRYIRAAASALGAGMALIVLMTTLAGARIKAAPSHSPTDDDPSIKAITVTSNLAISDTHPGAGADKTVYFSNTAPGVITLTFEISGTPTVTLTAGAAFDDGRSTYTSTITPATFAVAYSVAAAHTTQPHVVYTATDTNGGPTTVAITYVRDVTAPTASIAHPTDGQYVTTTRLVITGTSEDNDDGSGVRWVQVTTDTTWATGDGVAPWNYTWTLPITDGAVYTISARAEDYLGIFQHPAATRVITVDNVAPPNPDLVTTTDGTVTGPWISYNTIPVSWTEVADGSGVDYYYGWDQSSSTDLGSAHPLTTTKAMTNVSLPNGDNYFHLRTRDGAGNWTTDTLHLGPFRVDTLSPTVSISTPNSGAALTATQQPTVSVSGATSDGVSGVSAVSVTLDGGGTYTDAVVVGTSWDYEWTLPEEDNVTHTLRARARDEAGNTELSAGRVITVDNVRPANPDSITTTDGTMTGTWIAASTVPVTWNLVSDGSGAVYHYAWAATDTVTVESSDPYTTAPPVAGTTLSQSDNWFHLRTRDGAGNWTTATLHLGPFKVDTLSPTISISTPTSGAVLTTALTSIPVSGTAADVGEAASGITHVLVNTGVAWIELDDISPWDYTWTLPIIDNVVYTIDVRAPDAASNEGTDGVTVTVDTVAPITTTPQDAGEWSITSTLVFTWMEPYPRDAAGIAGYYVVITDSKGTTVVKTFTATQAYTITASNGVTEGVAYHARVRARDANGNVGDYGDTSNGITPDWTGPDVNYETPPIYVEGNCLSATGSTVFYTNTMLHYQVFWVQGNATDTLSGPGTITATPALDTLAPINDGIWSSWFFDYVVTNGMTESGHITVTTRDLVGNHTALVFTYTLDGDPPYTGSVEINDGAQFATAKRVTLTLHSDDGGCGVDEMCINNTGAPCTTWTPYVATQSWTLGDNDGDKTVYVWFRDHLQNISLAYTGTIALDTTPPTSTATSPDFENADTISVTYDAKDEVAGVATVTLWYKFDDGDHWTDAKQTLTGTTGVFVFTPTDEGTYYFQTIATDRAGQVENGDEPSGDGDASTIYDITSPTSEVASPTYVNTGTIPVTYTASDEVGDIEVSGIATVTLWYKFGDGDHWTDTEQALTGATGIFAFSPTHGNGEYCFQAVATDRAGNGEDEPSGEGDRCTVYDTIPPTSRAASPAYTNTAPIPVTYTASDDGSGIAEVALWYTFDSQGWTVAKTSTIASGTFAFSPTHGNGSYCFQTVATDGASNREDIPSGNGDSCTVYDTISPASEATSPEYDNLGSITVAYTATDDDGSGIAEVSLRYTFNGGDWMDSGLTSTGTSGTFVFSPTLGDGTYCFQTTAVDEAGNEEKLKDSGVFSCTIYDTTDPTSTATSPEYDGGGTIPVFYVANGEVAGIKDVALWYKFDSNGWKDTGRRSIHVTDTFHFDPSDDDGKYCFQTIATDNAGNIEGGPSDDGDSCTIYDTIEPTSTVTSSPEYENGDTISVTYVASDPHTVSKDVSGIATVTLWYKNEISGWMTTGETLTGITGTFVFTPTSEGKHYFQTIATDNAGHVEDRGELSETGDDFTVYDVTTPTSEIMSPAYVNTGTIPVTYTASDEVEGIEVSGIATVTLWYKFEDGDWTDSGLFSTAITGTFAITPTDDGKYCFQTIAKDEAGNVEKLTEDDGDACTVYDTTPPAAAAITAWDATECPIYVTWIATDTHSGIHSVTLWYSKASTVTSWTPTLTTEVEHEMVYATSDAFEFCPTDGDGTYLFAVTAVDNAGNVEPRPIVSETQALFDTKVPQSRVIQAPEYWNHSPIPLEWEATPSQADLTEVRLWYRFSAGEWTSTSITSATESGVFSFTPESGDGIYYFATVSKDELGKSELPPPPVSEGDVFVIYDTASPTSTATSPEYDNEGATPITYTASDEEPGVDDVSGIATVTLWYKFGASGGWTDTGQTLTDITGTFAFDPTDGDGTYYFQTVATDRATNAENEPSGDGDTHTIYDTTAPTSTAESPEYDNESLIPITYTANGDVAGLDTVTLWYKFDEGKWLTTEHTSTAIYDTFFFSPTKGDGAYYFQTIATDNANNVEDGPSGAGDTRSIYDVTSPTVVITAPEHTSDKTFVVEWDADASVSGLDHFDVEYRVGDDPWQDWLTGTTETSKIFTTSIGDITCGFSVTAHDNAGNSAYTETETYVGPFLVYLPLVVRSYPPQPVGSVVIEEEQITCVHQPNVTLHLSATVERDTVEWMCISNSPECHDNWIEFAEQYDWTLAGGVSGLRTVYVWFKGSAGGVSEEPTSDTLYLMWNGGFETGDFTGWQHGGELHQFVRSDYPYTGAHSVLLGDPNYPNEDVPEGSAWVYQAINVPSAGTTTVLSFCYRIFTYDVMWSETHHSYYDYFDVTLEDTGGNFLERLLRDGFTGNWQPNTLRDLGWECVSYDLEGYAGQTIRIRFANFNTAGAINDPGLNTYTYVDDVKMLK